MQNYLIDQGLSALDDFDFDVSPCGQDAAAPTALQQETR